MLPRGQNIGVFVLKAMYLKGRHYAASVLPWVPQFYIRHPIWDFQMKFSGLLKVVLIYSRQSYLFMTSVELSWTHVHLLKLLMLNIRTNNVQVIIW